LTFCLGSAILITPIQQEGYATSTQSIRIVPGQEQRVIDHLRLRARRYARRDREDAVIRYQGAADDLAEGKQDLALQVIGDEVANKMHFNYNPDLQIALGLRRPRPQHRG